MSSSKLVARIGLAAFLLTGGLAAPSFAQKKGEKKEEKKEEPKNDCKEGSTNIGCKKETKAETKIEAVKSNRGEPKKAEKGGPISSNQFDRRSVLQVRSEAKIKEALGYLEELINSSDKSDPDLPGYLYQYGEALYEQSKAANTKARILDDKIYEAKQKGDQPTVDKLVKEQAGYEKKAKDSRIEAFKKYKIVIDSYPEYKQRDEVIYYTGYNLKELASDMKFQADLQRDKGNTAEAEKLDGTARSYEEKVRDYYKTLLKEYPTSKFYPDALFEFAEFYYNDNDIDSALRAYEKLLAYPETNLYGYSIYKMGWCYFNLGDYQTAIKKFVEVVNFSRAAGASKDKAKVTLEKEALKDIVRAYAKFGTPEKARSFFQKIGGEERFKDMMAQLGGFYYEQGQFLDAIDMYEQVIDIDPKDETNYKHQYEICIAAMALATQNQAGAKERIVEEMQTLSKMYQDLVARKAAQERVKDAKELTAAILKEVAINWHAEAQKTKSKEQYQRAQYIYKEYITSFPDAEDVYTMSWNYAELLFQLGEMGDATKWGEAGDMYQRVVEMDSKGKYLKEAAFAAVISYRNSTLGEIRISSSSTPATPGASSGPMEIPERDKKMIKAYEFYTKSAPDGDKYTACRFEMGRILWSYKHYEEALPHMSEIVDKFPKDPTAGFAANILLDLLKNLGRNDDFKTYVFKFRSDPIFAANPELQESVEANYLFFRSKECDDLYKGEKWLDSASCYDALVSLNLQPENKRGAIYNAALAYERAKQIGQAIVLRVQLTEDPAYAIGPDGKPTSESLSSGFALGRLYMNIGYYSKASDYFEKFGLKFQGEKDALDALSNAAIFREGLGEFDKAVEDNKSYIAAAKGQMDKANKEGKKDEAEKIKADIAEAFFRIAEIRQREGVPAKTKGAYEEYLKTYSESGKADDVLVAKAWLAADLWKAGKRPDAIKRCNEIIDAVDKMGTEKASKELNEGLDAVAECAFYVGEMGYQTFESFKLPTNFDPVKIKEWFDNTLKAREDTSKLYMKVTTYGSKGWSLAALARIGMMSYKFRDGLFNAPLPTEVTVDVNGDGKPEKVKLKGAIKEEVEMKVRDQLNELALPLEDDAIKAFDTCLKGATQNSWFNEWSQLCEEYLNKISPSQYPLSAEWKAEPYKDEPITVPAAVVKVLK